MSRPKQGVKDRVPEELREWAGWRSWEEHLNDAYLEQLATCRMVAFLDDDPMAGERYAEGISRMTGGGGGLYSEDMIGYDLAAELADCKTDEDQALCMFDWELECY